MSSKSTVSLTVGVSGSGKTYYRCAVFLMDEWLPNHEGLLISNYPINIDEVEKDWPGASRRIEIIPEDVLKSWRDGSSGPWDYFNDRDISGCHIAIDEIHNYCGKSTDNKVRKKWQQFIGELRHQGATIEFLTQAESKCAKEIINEAEIRYEIQNGENRRLPFLGYRMGDLYEFRAKLLGRYLCPSYCLEKIQADGKWKTQDNHMFYRLPKYFKYYDSFSAPQSGKGKGNRSEQRPWEKYNWLMLVLWFYLQYPVRISLQFLCVGVFVWFFFLGGLPSIMNKWFASLNRISNMNVKKLNVQNKSDDDVKQVEKRDYKANEEIKDDKGKVIGRVVQLNPFTLGVDFACPLYVRIKNREYKLGDDLYEGKITSIDVRYNYIIVDGYIPISFSWIGDGANE